MPGLDEEHIIRRVQSPSNEPEDKKDVTSWLIPDMAGKGPKIANKSCQEGEDVLIDGIVKGFRDASKNSRASSAPSLSPEQSLRTTPACHDNVKFLSEPLGLQLELRNHKVQKQTQR